MTNPVAMIVGGGSGIGADSARKMSEMGYDVAVFSSSGKGEALGKELGGLGFTGSNLMVADLEAVAAPNKIKKVLKGYDAIKRNVYQGRGEKVRALFDKNHLPQREQAIRNQIK